MAFIMISLVIVLCPNHQVTISEICCAIRSGNVSEKPNKPIFRHHVQKKLPDSKSKAFDFAEYSFLIKRLYNIVVTTGF